MLKIIKKRDAKSYPKPDGHTRFYSYLTTIRKQIAKVTVAVRHKYTKWYCKQVAIHILNSKIAYAKDLTFYTIAGYVVDWYDIEHPEYKCPWYAHELKLFDPYAPVVNIDYLDKFPKYKYLPYKTFCGCEVLKFLKLYEEYPEMEYLIKSGFGGFSMSKTLLRQVRKDKNFHKWLVANKNTILLRHCYCSSILKAYKTNKPLSEVDDFEFEKRQFIKSDTYKLIKSTFIENLDDELKKLFKYFKKENISEYLYKDYLSACIDLKLDLTKNKHRYPRDFMNAHDRRIEEAEKMKKARILRSDKRQIIIQQKQRRKMLKRFYFITQKYSGLSAFVKNKDYAVLLAFSPDELKFEGKSLNHCVGKNEYDEKIANENSLIFFLRKADDLSSPYVTVEYSLKKKDILQCYAKGNTTPKTEVKDFLYKKWLPKINKQVKAIAA